MTEIGFYHLTRSPLVEALPRLLEKVVASGQRAVLRCGDGARVEALDRALWTYGKDSFLPHGTRADGHAEMQPIFLTDGEDRPNGAAILVVVDGAPFGDLSPYDRCLDMFDGLDETAVATARDRWRWGREQGHRLVYWQQNERGGWVMAREEEGRPAASLAGGPSL
ncbi:MAG TPA: DNA polymerase III subunit chi [Geminicoccaceae bacterium]|nr:DNA polymerase III subunit chi [Geminicoccus sp.]HMU49341.1 DNA polymerase III subunit chi [Geminicoccaceae bacterium]